MWPPGTWIAVHVSVCMCWKFFNTFLANITTFLPLFIQAKSTESNALFSTNVLITFTQLHTFTPGSSLTCQLLWSSTGAGGVKGLAQGHLIITMRMNKCCFFTFPHTDTFCLSWGLKSQVHFTNIQAITAPLFPQHTLRASLFVHFLKSSFVFYQASCAKMYMVFPITPLCDIPWGQGGQSFNIFLHL